MHDGEVACPSRMPLRRVVGSSGCRTAARAERHARVKRITAPAAEVETFSTPDCTSSVRSLDVNGSRTTNGTPLTNAVAYEYTPSSGCAVKDAPAVLGSEKVSSASHSESCALGFWAGPSDATNPYSADDLHWAAIASASAQVRRGTV